MTKQRSLPLILFALCLTGWIACTQQRQPCLTPKTASLIIETIHFQTDTSTVPADTTLPSGVFAPITAASNIAYLYPPQSVFTISLSPDSTFCRWLFKTDTTGTAYDTVSFYYERNSKFLSNACGFTYFYGIDSVRSTHLMIDSIHILNSSVTTNVNTKHLQIFIHHNF